MPYSLTDLPTDWQTLKDRATQLLIKYKSGALVTQLKKRPDPTASSSPLSRDQTSLVWGTSHVDPSAVVVQSTFLWIHPGKRRWCPHMSYKGQPTIYLLASLSARSTFNCIWWGFLPNGFHPARGHLQHFFWKWQNGQNLETPADRNYFFISHQRLYSWSNFLTELRYSGFPPSTTLLSVLSSSEVG